MASPLMIEIGLWYHCRTTDYRDGDLTAPAVKDAIRDFEQRGLLARAEAGAPRKYIGTEALTVWVDALCNVGWPVKTWKIAEAEPEQTRRLRDTIASMPKELRDEYRLRDTFEIQKPPSGWMR